MKGRRSQRPLADPEYDAPSGQLHTCSSCGKQDVWGPPWEWYGSWKDWDDVRPIYKACSPECMARREEVAQREQIAKNIDAARSEEQRLETQLAQRRIWREQEEARLAALASQYQDKP